MIYLHIIYIHVHIYGLTWDEGEPLDDEAGRCQMHEARRPPHEQAQARRHHHAKHLIHMQS